MSYRQRLVLAAHRAIKSNQVTYPYGEDVYVRLMVKRSIENEYA